jgi:hypothetical protein
VAFKASPAQQLAIRDTDDESDNWDGDFEEGLSLSKLKRPSFPFLLTLSTCNPADATNLLLTAKAAPAEPVSTTEGDTKPTSQDWNMRTIMPGRSSVSPLADARWSFWSDRGKQNDGPALKQAAQVKRPVLRYCPSPG